MSPLDGHINRSLSGKTVEAAYKNGRYLVLRFTNGEEAEIAWATPNGVGIEGEPCLVRMNVKVLVPGVGVVGTVGEVR